MDWISKNKYAFIILVIMAGMAGAGIAAYFMLSAPADGYVMPNKPDNMEEELREVVYGIGSLENKGRLEKLLRPYGTGDEVQLLAPLKSTYTQKEIVAYYRDILRAYGWSDFTHEEKYRYTGILTKEKYFDGYSFYKGKYRFELRFVKAMGATDKFMQQDNETAYNILVEAKKWWKIL